MVPTPTSLTSFTLIREMFPSFSLDIIVVSVPYPGASPEEVEEGICLKLEDAIEGIEGIKRYTTNANENIGTAIVECEDGDEESYDRLLIQLDFTLAIRYTAFS